MLLQPQSPDSARRPPITSAQEEDSIQPVGEGGTAGSRSRCTGPRNKKQEARRGGSEDDDQKLWPKTASDRDEDQSHSETE
jgi:hypothetical protein